MQILSISFIKEFNSKIINIHSSLLHSFMASIHTLSKAGRSFDTLLHYPLCKWRDRQWQNYWSRNYIYFYKIFWTWNWKKNLNFEHILYPKGIAKLLDKEININENNIMLCYDRKWGLNEHKVL